jgi:lysyl-tRNA synthetase, class II
MSDEPSPARGNEPLGEFPQGSASAPRESEPAAEELDFLEVRRAKLDKLRADGIDPFPPAFAGVTPIAEIRAAHEGLEAGAETDATYRVAGRLWQRRGQGKMAFLDLVDRSGRIQLQARADVLGPERMERLVDLDLGDLIGVDGTVFVTRRGELSLRVDDYTVLAKSLRPPPDKHHGLRDIETRFRQRELDLMANAETRELFITRARIISAVRRYLDENGFIEVETPVLQPLYGGAMARPFTTHHNALDRGLYLRIATELYLKRLIVGGLERVYELGKDFRNEGISYKHNPEFTMVEWYEAYADYEDEMRRVEELLPRVAEAAHYAGDIDFAATPYRRVGFIDAIREATGIDITEHTSAEALAAAIRAADLDIPTKDLEWPALADDLFSKAVEPTLIQPTFVVDYPKALSPFAKDHRVKPGLVERFEAFAGGMEIANAFTELNDPDEQRARFEAQVRLAEAGDEEAQPYDEVYVEALEHGMPPTGGIGVGIDRLVLLMTGRHSIREIVLFPAMRD